MSEWNNFQLGEIVTLQRGYDLPTNKRKDGNIPVIGSAGITGWHNKSKTNGPGVTIGRSGSSIGVATYCDKAFWPHNAVLFVKDFKGNHKKFIYYLLKSVDFSSYNSGAAQPSLNRNLIYQINIKLPDFDTQHRIASILSAFDDLIENNTRRIAILEEMARLIYREWFVYYKYPGHENDRMVESGTELGEVPEGWEVKKLEEFGRIETGKTPRKKDPENYGDYMPFIKTPDMHDQFFAISTADNLSEIGANSQKKKTLPPNSICVSCIGTAGVIALTSVPSQTNQQINSIILENHSCREFLYYAIEDLRPLMEKIGSTGATMTNVSKGKFKALEVIWPGDKMIDLYHENVASMFDQIKALQKQNIKLKATRDLLLPRLISGKIKFQGEPSHDFKKN
jgi:type I restriction enzyme, S subunit